MLSKQLRSAKQTKVKGKQLVASLKQKQTVVPHPDSPVINILGLTLQVRKHKLERLQDQRK